MSPRSVSSIISPPHMYALHGAERGISGASSGDNSKAPPPIEHQRSPKPRRGDIFCKAHYEVHTTLQRSGCFTEVGDKSGDLNNSISSSIS